MVEHYAFDAKRGVRELDSLSTRSDIYVDRPRELDHLHLSQAGFLAQRRLARGLQLNEPEVSTGCWSVPQVRHKAIALIAAQCLEFIRDGDSVSTLMEKGKRLLGRRQVLPGVAHDCGVIFLITKKTMPRDMRDSFGFTHAGR